jgi:hypothetical protein
MQYSSQKSGKWQAKETNKERRKKKDEPMKAK